MVIKSGKGSESADTRLVDSWTLLSHCGLLVVDSKLWTLICGLLVWTQDF